MVTPVPVGLVTHARRVCSLYKRAVRNYESWHTHFVHWRYDAVVVRARFDKNKDIKDLRLAKHLLEEGEKELESILHPAPLYFAESVEGVAYEREEESPDWVLDYWHPTEKDMYPKYFALREKRKIEYEEFFKKQYPDAPTHFSADHH